MSLAPPEQYVDLCSTTLNASYTAGAGSMTVVSTGSPFPQSQQFHFYVADATTKLVKAIGKVTAITSGTVFAVSMTTDANCNSSDIFVLSLCAGAMNQIRADMSQQGVFASRPGNSYAGQPGDVYRSTDSPRQDVFTGSAWNPYGPIFALADPTIPTFSWRRQSNATISAANGMQYMSIPKTENNNELHALDDSRSWASGKHLYAAILYAQYGGGNGSAMGIYIGDSSGKLVFYGIVPGSPEPGLNVYHIASAATTLPASTFADQVSSLGAPIFFGIYDDGTNFNYLTSADGVNFNGIRSEGRTAYLSSPTIFGFAGSVNNGNYPTNFSVISWNFF